MWFRTFGLIVTLAILALPLPPKAQPPAKVPRIGWLTLSAPSGSPSLLDTLRQGLRELGWVDGQNLAIESRNAEGQPGLEASVDQVVQRFHVDNDIPGA